jgi:hypothetical protein
MDVSVSLEGVEVNLSGSMPSEKLRAYGPKSLGCITKLLGDILETLEFVWLR